MVFLLKKYPPHCMSKRTISKYLELEAESGSEEYYSEEASEGIDNIVQVPKSRNYMEHAQDIEKRYAHIIKESEEDDEGEEYYGEDGLRSRALPIPTLGSPLLFLVRCKIGSERNICLRIMENTKNKNIFSVIQKDGLKGYIYIEAIKKQDVSDAIAGIRTVSHARISVVPRQEMIDAMTYRKSYVVSDYARVAGGKYRGDLVKILENHEEMVKIQAVPRINGFKRRFDPSEYRSDAVKKDDGYYYNRDFYRNGLLEKLVLKSSLEFDAEPTNDELMELNLRKHVEVNDEVRVKRGDLINLVGTVVDIFGNYATLVSDGKRYEVAMCDVEKNFEIGQEVSVNGFNGVILKIDDGRAIVASNGFTEEIACSVDDLRPPVTAHLSAPPRTPVRQFRMRRDPLVNKRAVIQSGEYKGYGCVIREITRDGYRVQMEVGSRFLNVPRDYINVAAIDDQGREGEPEEDVMAGSKTPGYKTPGYRTPGYKTPGYRTPGYKTPGYRTPGYRTPGYRTPGYKTPSAGGRDWRAEDELGDIDWMKEKTTYDGALVTVGAKEVVLSDFAGDWYISQDGNRFQDIEIEYVIPEKYDNVIIMNGENKGVQGVLAVVEEGKGIVKSISGDNYPVHLNQLTKKIDKI